MQRSRFLLVVGIAVPIIYFGTVAVASWMTPGYSHLSRYVSELGMAGSPSAGLFNGGILLTAVATIVASLGLYTAARGHSTGRLWPILAGAALGLFGAGLVFGAIFPMPDPRHGGFGLGMAIHLSPLFLALALRSSTDLTLLIRYLYATTIVMLVLLAITMGVGGLVTRANVGLFQRIYALAVFGWIGVAAFALFRMRSSE